MSLVLTSLALGSSSFFFIKKKDNAGSKLPDHILMEKKKYRNEI